jgi:formamidopyrimidine-DNA glycosylase
LYHKAPHNSTELDKEIFITKTEKKTHGSREENIKKHILARTRVALIGNSVNDKSIWKNKN